MRQKFNRLTFVRITDEMPPWMAHFEKGFKGIVAGTYAQIYGGQDIKSYMVYHVKGDRIVNKIAWYDEDQLTVCQGQDRTYAEELIEAYLLDK